MYKSFKDMCCMYVHMYVSHGIRRMVEARFLNYVIPILQGPSITILLLELAETENYINLILTFLIFEHFNSNSNVYMYTYAYYRYVVCWPHLST